MQEDFKRILTLVDFSRASIHAAEEAAMIASKFNSKLHLLHVSSNPGLAGLFSPGVYFFRSPESGKQQNQYNKARLKKLKTELEERFGLDIEYHESNGKLCDTIRKYVEGLNIDLVVLGAKRKIG